MTQDNQTQPSQTPAYAGIFFVLLIMGTNLALSLSPERTREYLTASLRSPNGDFVRGAMEQFPAFRLAARTAVMDAESYVRLQTLANYLILTAFFFYMSYLRGLSQSALRLSLRLFSLVGLTYSAVLLFDPRPLGHEQSAVHWFQSVAVILTAAAALVNYLLVRATMPGREGLKLRVFWSLATAGFTLAALDSRFQVQARVTSKLKAWMLSSNVAGYSTAGSEWMDRFFLLGVLVASLLVVASFRRSLDRYRSEPGFDAHQPLGFALLFLAVASLCQMAQATGKLQVYFGHLGDICHTATVVLFLASFAAAAASQASARLRLQATSSDASYQAEHAIMDASAPAPRPGRRQAPVVIQEPQDQDAIVDANLDVEADLERHPEVK